MQSTAHLFNHIFHSGSLNMCQVTRGCVSSISSQGSFSHTTGYFETPISLTAFALCQETCPVWRECVHSLERQDGNTEQSHLPFHPSVNYAMSPTAFHVFFGFQCYNIKFVNSNNAFKVLSFYFSILSTNHRTSDRCQHLFFCVKNLYIRP